MLHDLKKENMAGNVLGKVCQDLVKRQDNVWGHVITNDETRVYQYDLETKGTMEVSQFPKKADGTKKVLSVKIKESK